MVGAPDVVQPWMPRAARDSDACLWHVSIVGGARRRGCAAAGVPEFFNGLLGPIGSVVARNAPPPPPARPRRPRAGHLVGRAPAAAAGVRARDAGGRQRRPPL